ncbi:MAG: alanine racemase [Pseudomonadota bacterium]
MIDQLPTPALLLDRPKLRRNINRLATRIGGLGGTLRPHVKTNKCIDVVDEIIAAGSCSGITVSTLSEAEYFFQHDIADITYAVGIAPNKLGAVADLMARGCDLKIILDNPDMARLVAAEGERRGVTFSVLIELDTDGHRAGAKPEGDELLAIGQLLHESAGSELTGVLTHAGESYGCRTSEALLAMARQERDRSVHAAKRLRAQRLPCPIVSIGSTPTALAVDDLTGVTEVRAGVYVFFDLVMAGIGVCAPEEIAISVLASVIGYQKDKSWAITDAGWMAMSRDRGTAHQEVDQGYGLVTDLSGSPISDLIVSDSNQEHGIISSRRGEALPFSQLPLGSLVRILPNHACATAAKFDRYVVMEDSQIVAEWSRINGW